MSKKIKMNRFFSNCPLDVTLVQSLKLALEKVGWQNEAFPVKSRTLRARKAHVLSAARAGHLESCIQK